MTWWTIDTLRQYRTFVSILLFGALFSGFHYLKPKISYDSRGRIRLFGIGYRHKTVIPVWLVAVLLAIASFTVVLRSGI